MLSIKQAKPLPWSKFIVLSPGSWTCVLAMCGVSWATVPINKNNCLVYLSCSNFHFLFRACSQMIVSALPWISRLVVKKPPLQAIKLVHNHPPTTTSLHCALSGVQGTSAIYSGFLTAHGGSQHQLEFSWTVLYPKPVTVLGSSVWKQRRNFNTCHSCHINEIIYFKGLR